MQIPTSAGMLANSVLPVTPTQGALLSQVGETAGSTSFAPVEAVSSISSTRPLPEQKAQPDTAPENGGRSDIASINTDDIAETRDAQENSKSSSAESQTNTRSESSQRESDQQSRKDAQQERQQQQDLDIIRSLSQRDAEVRAHENAHSAVGGQYAGAANYTYQRGPDGVNYAVGGEVPIDVSIIQGNPQATLEKMQLVQRAALAPAEPSSQDRRVAALAAQQANQARAEIVSSSRESSNAGKAEKVESSESVPRVANSSEDDEKSKSDNKNFEAANERIAKINEILVAISQNDTRSASGQLLDAVV